MDRHARLTAISAGPTKDRESTVRAIGLIKAVAIIAVLSVGHFGVGFAAFLLLDIHDNNGVPTLIDFVAEAAVNILWFPFLYLAKDSAGYTQLFFLVANSVFWGLILFALWTAAARSLGRRFSLSAMLAIV